MRKLFAVAVAVTALGVVAPSPAHAIGCPPTCVVSGLVEGTGIVPDPDQLNFSLNWTAVDLRGDVPAVSQYSIHVVATLELNYSPFGPSISRGQGVAYLNTDGDPDYERGYTVTVVRTGYPLTGAITIDAAKAANEYTGTDALSIDLNYVGFADNTNIFNGVAVELYD